MDINVNIKPSLLNTVDPVPRRQGHNPIGQAKMRVRNWLLCFLWHMAKLTNLLDLIQPPIKQEQD